MQILIVVAALSIPSPCESNFSFADVLLIIVFFFLLQVVQYGTSILPLFKSHFTFKFCISVYLHISKSEFPS